MIPSNDVAWKLRRLLTGQKLNGELRTVPEPWRGLAERLSAAADAGARGDVLADFLAGRPDEDAIVKSLADADPAGPAPEAETGVDVPAKTRPRVKMIRAADVVCRPVDWLWEPRLPRGMLSMFAGDPKLGKSLVTVATAAAVSRGAPLPGGGPPGEAGSVVLLSAEDDSARTIVPRLKAAGADLSKVHILESVYLDDGTEALPSLRADVAAVEEAVAGLGDCRLVVIDPVTAYLAGADDHKNGELRGVLSPLKTMAERTDAAVILVSHLNKSSGANGKHRVSGSIAYVGACRANFLFVRDRDDPTGRRVLMIENGCNLAGAVPGLAYRIEDRGDGPTVEWEADPVDVTAEQALSAVAEDPDERADRRECDDWLRETLSAGPVPQPEIESGGRDAGFSKDQLRGAKKRLRVVTKRVGFGPGSKCHWRLPESAPAPPAPGYDRPIDGTQLA